MRLHDGCIILNAAVEYDEDLDDGETLGGLGYDKILDVKDTTDVGRVTMYPSVLCHK